MGCFKHLVAPVILLIALAALVPMTPLSAGWFDSGEFITAAWSLGIAHNPGYPIYLTLTHAWCRALPIASIPFRMHLLSIVLTLLTLVIMNRSLIRLSKGYRYPWAGLPLLIAGFLLSDTLRNQGTSNEVYPLDLFFFVWTFDLLLAARTLWNPRTHYFLILIGTLSLLNHYSALFWLPILFGIWNPFGTLRRINRGHLTLSVLVVLLLTGSLLYLPLRAIQDPAINWGNPQTCDRFMDHVLARSHRAVSMPSLDVEQRWTRWLEFIGNLGRNTPLAANLLLGVGVIGCSVVWPRLFLTCVVLFVSHSIYVVFINVVPFEATPFGVPVLACIILSAASGILNSFRRSGMTAMVSIAALLIALPIAVARHTSALNRPRQIASAILSGLRPDAVLLTYSDSLTFNLLALQTTERYREDVAVISDLYPGLILSNASHREFDNALRQCGLRSALVTAPPRFWRCIAGVLTRPVYREIRPGDKQNDLLYEVDGVLWRLNPMRLTPPSTGDIDSFVAFYKKGSQDPISRDVSATLINTLGLYLESWNCTDAAETVYRQAIEVLPDCGEACVNLGLIAYRKGELDTAIEWMLRAISASPDLAIAHQNLGLLLLRRNELSGANEALRRTDDLKSLPPHLRDLLKQLGH